MVFLPLAPAKISTYNPTMVDFLGKPSRKLYTISNVFQKTVFKWLWLIELTER